ncbi:hypothetical protein HYT32_00585 [Candidatus Roizmanbacteria bacterium]|nr:hypothetical protein [Candidatus Roizmanbacteria bacterium]
MDPKLKEAYDRVMGIETRQEIPPPPPPASSSSGPQIISQPPISSPLEPATQDVIPKSIIVGYNSTSQNEKIKSNKVSWLWTVFMIIVLVLLLVYFFVWAKLLDIKIPLGF